MPTLDREDTRHMLPCCGVTAIAVFTGAKFEDVWNHIKLHGRKGANWKGSTYHRDQRSAMKAFNKGRTVVKKVEERMTLKTFQKHHARPGVMYMIRTTRHQQVLYGEYVVDQGGVRHISEYHGARKYVKHFWAKQV